jgi:uncharacterized protein (DUF433 family)
MMLDRITVNPTIHAGKPCIKGTRITVENILELLGEGISFEEIIRDYYPDLTIEDIRACLRYGGQRPGLKPQGYMTKAG